MKLSDLAIGDIFITDFWGVDEVCKLYSVEDGFISFQRLESIRSQKGAIKDYCMASLPIDRCGNITVRFLHPSQWYRP